jgi:hypothetical protein
MFSLDVLNSFFPQRYVSLGISWFTLWNVFVDNAKEESSLSFIECVRDNFLHQMIDHHTRERIGQELPLALLSCFAVFSMFLFASVLHVPFP